MPASCRRKEAMISIEVDGEDYDVPSSAADTNWSAAQVGFEQALATAVNDALDLISNGADAAAGTAGSGTGISGATTLGATTVVHKITIGYAAVQTANTVKDVVAWTLPAKTRVTRVLADVTQVFDGGAISDCDCTVGASGGGDDFLLSFDVDTATGVFGNSYTELGRSVVGAASWNTDITWSATVPVTLRFTSVGADLSALTTGSMTLYIECCTYA